MLRGSGETLGHIGASLALDVNEGAVVGFKSELNVKQARPAVRDGEPVGRVMGCKSRIQPLASYRQAPNVGDHQCPLPAPTNGHTWALIVHV